MSAIVGASALAFVLLIGVGTVIERQVSRQLDSIEARYVPQVELGPQLDGALDRPRRGLQDGVASQAQSTAARVRLVVSVGCLLLVITLALWLGRGVLRSLGELAAGVERFGKGDFARPIRVLVEDELGEVAQQANQMAASLKRL